MTKIKRRVAPGGLRRTKEREAGVRSVAIEGDNDRPSRSAILDAAEQVFGTHGFHGGSMREIAVAAGIAQSLVHYHYENKATLYEAVFERRAKVIRQVRQERLEALFSRGLPVTLEGVLEILFMPLDELIDEDRSRLGHYVQMLASVTMSRSERSVAIVRRFYDPSAHLFIEAFEKVLPKLVHERAVWAYLFAIGARMQAHGASGRASRLGAESGLRRPYELLLRFVAAGIRNLDRA